MKDEEITLNEIINEILHFHVAEYTNGTHPDLWEAEILWEYNNKVKE